MKWCTCTNPTTPRSSGYAWSEPCRITRNARAGWLSMASRRRGFEALLLDGSIDEPTTKFIRSYDSYDDASPFQKQRTTDAIAYPLSQAHQQREQNDSQRNAEHLHYETASKLAYWCACLPVLR